MFCAFSGGTLSFHGRRAQFSNIIGTVVLISTLLASLMSAERHGSQTRKVKRDE